MSKNNDRLFGGVYSYVMTPFDKKGDVDHGVLEEYIERLIAADVDGVTLMASTTEVHYLQEAERKSVIETACRVASGRVVVNGGVGAHSTRQSLYFAEHARDQGVDRLIAELPNFFPINFEGAYRHYATIGDQIGLPLRIYNFSKHMRYDFTPDQVIRMADIDMVDSFKEATGDPQRTRDVVGLCGDRLQIYSGFHWMLPENIRDGAVGWEGGMHPAFAPECVKLFRALVEDHQSESSKAQYDNLKPLFFFLKAFGVTQAVKAMCEWTDIKLGAPRLPQPPLPESAKPGFKLILQNAGIIN